MYDISSLRVKKQGAIAPRQNITVAAYSQGGADSC